MNEWWTERADSAYNFVRVCVCVCVCLCVCVQDDHVYPQVYTQNDINILKDCSPANEYFAVVERFGHGLLARAQMWAR